MEDQSREDRTEGRDALTSFHVRRARAGDEESLGWLVTRFAPLLRACAQYRLGKRLRRLYDPEDIVNDVWMVILPRLSELPTRDDRRTPVLLKFLTSTLRLRINNLVQKHIAGKPAQESARDESPLDEVAARTTGMLRRLERKELRDLVARSIESLERGDREILILRGLEQHPYEEIAAVLGGEPKSLAVRYQRALARLRRALPGSVYEDLIDE